MTNHVNTSSIRNRRLLLWVCQRHELLSDQSVHDYSLDPASALLRYRETATQVEKDLAALYWETAWFEGARSHLLTAMSSQPAANTRSLVLLSAEGDIDAKAISSNILTAHVLPGLPLLSSKPAA